MFELTGRELRTSNGFATLNRSNDQSVFNFNSQSAFPFLFTFCFVFAQRTESESFFCRFSSLPELISHHHNEMKRNFAHQRAYSRRSVDLASDGEGRKTRPGAGRYVLSPFRASYVKYGFPFLILFALDLLIRSPCTMNYQRFFLALCI